MQRRQTPAGQTDKARKTKETDTLLTASLSYLQYIVQINILGYF